MQLVDYKICLNTGEVIEVAELDNLISPFLQSVKFLAAAASVLQKCPCMPRNVVEEAKLGYTKQFEALLHAHPIAALMQFETPICRLINDCAMADKQVCTTHNVRSIRHKTTGGFPICWEYQCPDNTPEDFKIELSALVFAVVHAWRERKYVIQIMS